VAVTKDRTFGNAHIRPFSRAKIGGTVSEDIRWLQRFANFERAFFLLREAFDQGIDSMRQLEKEGTIQRFELSYELAWKTMKDYLEYQGLVVDPATPRNTIKQAFAAKLLPDAQTWIDMMLSRSVLSHSYDFAVFEKVLREIASAYLPAIADLHDFLIARKLSP
jgi:nucleotidyltransferase substrate binding protein (TIGR01987 family)